MNYSNRSGLSRKRFPVACLLFFCFLVCGFSRRFVGACWSVSSAFFTKTKREADLCGQKVGGKETSDGVVCTTKQISVHEMRKKQQQDNNARNM